MSYLRELSAQISQIVFSSSFDRFTAYYNIMSKNFKNYIFYVSSVHKYHKLCSSFEFYGLLQL